MLYLFQTAQFFLLIIDFLFVNFQTSSFSVIGAHLWKMWISHMYTKRAGRCGWWRLFVGIIQRRHRRLLQTGMLSDFFFFYFKRHTRDEYKAKRKIHEYLRFERKTYSISFSRIFHIKVFYVDVWFKRRKKILKVLFSRHVLVLYFTTNSFQPSNIYRNAFLPIRFIFEQKKKKIKRSCYIYLFYNSDYLFMYCMTL